MLIDESSIVSLEKYFYKFIKGLERTNYNVSVQAESFSYTGDDIFSLENLKQIFPDADPDIEGKIVAVNVQAIETAIGEAMSYYSDDGLVKGVTDKNLIYERTETFFKLIDKCFPCFPCKAYEHLPASNSYFDYGVMWSFCYVFLKDGNGFVLDAGAFD